MRTDANVADSGPALPSATLLVQLLQTASPINWYQLLRRRLAVLGVTEPADLPPSKLAELRDYVFRVAKQAGIKDPSAWIAHRAQPDAAAAAAAQPACRMEVAAPAPERKCLGEPVRENSPTKASVASPPRPGPRELFGTTKAEVLSRAKAAIDGRKEDLGIIAARLAYAQRAFHASQREIGRAVGRSASWVNRLLKWRRSGCKESSPFGPTTRAGRRAHRNGSNMGPGGWAGAEQPKQDESKVSPVGDCSLPDQPGSPDPWENDGAPDGLLPSAEELRGDNGCREPETPLESGSRHAEKQKVPRTNAKRSPERMRTVIEALRECPSRARAAAKAGIHRQALRYWEKRSEAGDDGYDIEWEGYPWRFHEACEAAIQEAWDGLLDQLCDLGLGPITYKLDQHRLGFGYEGVDAYARDANGDFIVEARGPGNMKILQRLLELLRREKWGPPRKQKGGVLVIGDRTANQREKGYTASAKVRQWNAASKLVRETNA